MNILKPGRKAADFYDSAFADNAKITTPFRAQYITMFFTNIP